MKKIVCELCENTEFTKEGGFFVCQGCGTKYSLEEAKSMMREVEGDAAQVVVGTPVTSSIPMGNPNQAQIDNILVLATTAYEAQNYAEAENYCNRAIELDVTCYKAWNLKGKAVGWQSKIDNLRIEEASHSFCKAIDFAPEEEKADLKDQAVEELKKLGLALISLRKQRFAGSPDKKELNGFTEDKKVILNSLLVLLSHGNAVGMPEGYLEEVAKQMNEAGVAALNMTRKAWAKVEHPSQKDLAKYVDWNGNICEVFRQAISTSDDDDEEDIVRYKNLIIALKEPIGKYSQTRQWNSFWEKFEWINEYSLNDQAVKTRNNEASSCEAKIKEIEKKVIEKKEAEAKKAAEEKKARIEAYWAAHADEKAAFEAEKKELETKKDSLSKEVADLDAQIKALTSAGNVPSEDEDIKIRDQIRDLVNRRANLGLFAGKEKKQISEEIDILNGRRDALKAKIEQEKKDRQAEADVKLAPIQAKRHELSSELDKVIKRIAAIVAEFEKDPE